MTPSIELVYRCVSRIENNGSGKTINFKSMMEKSELSFNFVVNNLVIREHFLINHLISNYNFYLHILLPVGFEIQLLLMQVCINYKFIYTVLNF